MTSGRNAAADRILDAVRRAGDVTRGELVSGCGLSRSTVSAVVDRLLRSGLLREDDLDACRPAGASARGRPARVLRLTAQAGGVIGLAFGHSDLRAAAADLSGVVHHERHVDLAVDHSANSALDAAADLARDALRTFAPGAPDAAEVVVGLPCPIDAATGRVVSNNILPGWIGVRPAAELSERLGRAVRVENDANLAALGEHRYGSGRGHSGLIYVKASTGIGAGLILDGRLFRGARGTAGEIGHTQITANGAVCRCGNRGCLETVAAAGPVLSALGQAQGRPLRFADLLGLLAAGDIGARRVLAEAGRLIGETLAALCNALDPELIVVGGELGEASPVFAQSVQESISRYAQPMAGHAVIRAGLLGARAEMLGAVAAGVNG